MMQRISGQRPKKVGYGKRIEGLTSVIVCWERDTGTWVC